MHRFQFKAYRRRFSKEWATASQAWSSREGIIVRLEDGDGRPGYGEIAPIEGFGSESFLTALGVCTAIGDRLEIETLDEVLMGSPATRFALEAAIDMIGSHDVWPDVEAPWPVCGLARDLLDEECWQTLLEHGYRCMKFKIGVGDFSEERRMIERIVSQTAGEIALRLDANGGLDSLRAVEWLEFLADVPGIEYLEQPMAKGEEDTMERLCLDYPTTLALDESVCRVDDLKRWRDRQWPGVFVLKPLLSGSVLGLVEELEQGEIDVVYSSALETQVGAVNGLAIALRNPAGRRALGFDTNRLFSDRLTGFDIGPFLQPGACPSFQDLEDLWNRI